MPVLDGEGLHAGRGDPPSYIPCNFDALFRSRFLVCGGYHSFGSSLLEETKMNESLDADSSSSKRSATSSCVLVFLVSSTWLDDLYDICDDYI